MFNNYSSRFSLTAPKRKSRFPKLRAYVGLAASLTLLPSISYAAPFEDLDPTWARIYSLFVVEVTAQRLAPPSNYVFTPSISTPLLPNLPQFQVTLSSNARPVAANAKPPADKNSKDDCDSGDNPSTDQPVVIATGKKILREVDFETVGTTALSLTRNYSAPLQGSNVLGDFGYNWENSLHFPSLILGNCLTDPRLKPIGISGCRPSFITVQLPSGEQYSYVPSTNNPDSYLPSGTATSASTKGALTLSREVTIKIGSKNWVYDNTFGRLIRIEDRNQTVMAFEYQNRNSKTEVLSPALLKVTAASGQTLNYVYNGIGTVQAVVLPDGSQWTYAYDANKRLVQVNPPNSATGIRSYHYEDATNGNLVTGISVDGQRITRYTYDGVGRAVRSGSNDDERFDTFAFSANGSGVQTVVGNQRGESVTYTFADFKGTKQLTQISKATTSSCSASASRRTYDGNGYLSAEYDWKGQLVAAYNYNLDGQLIQLTEYNAGQIARVVDNTWANGFLSQSVYSNGKGLAYKRAAYAYVDGDRPSSIETFDLVTGQYSRRIDYSYTYFPTGVLASLTTTRANYGSVSVSVNRYNELGFLESKTNALGQTYSFANHNVRGYPKRATELNGLTTDIIYNAFDKPISVTQNLPTGPRVTQFIYDGSQRLTDTIYANGSAVRTRYNVNGRVTANGNAQGQFSSTSYDSVANSYRTQSDRMTASLVNGATAVSGAGSFVSDVRLNSMEKMWKVTGQAGQLAIYEYDQNGNLTNQTDVQGRTSTSQYDGLNRVTSSRAADGAMTQYAYGPYIESGVTSVTNAKNSVTTFARSIFGDALIQNSPDSGPTYYDYDAAGRLIRETKATGVSIVNTFDALDRITSRQAGGLTQSFFYDEGSFGKGRLTRVNDQTGETTYTYNAAGDLVQQTTTIYTNTYTVRWTYDSIGRMVSMIYPNGFARNYEYDGFGRVTRMTTNQTGAGSVLADSMVYQPVSNGPLSWRFGNGITRIANYDADARLTSLAAGSIQNRAFGYSNVNTITSVTDGVSAAQNSTFTYNAVDRLLSVSKPSDSQTFTLDSIGDRLTQSRTTVTTKDRKSVG